MKDSEEGDRYFVVQAIFSRTGGNETIIHVVLKLVVISGIQGGKDVVHEPLLSPPRPGTNWADWSDAMGREMYLCRALDQLNFEYPPDSDS